MKIKKVIKNYDGNYIKCYINGELVGGTSDSGSIGTQNTALYIGSDGGGADYFTGRLDEVKIYNYGRSAEQIKEDVNLGYGTYFK